MSRDDRAADRERRRIAQMVKWHAEQAAKAPDWREVCRCGCGALAVLADSTWWRTVFYCHACAEAAGLTV
jgi:hypothetical protein